MVTKKCLRCRRKLNIPELQSEKPYCKQCIFDADREFSDAHQSSIEQVIRQHYSGVSKVTFFAKKRSGRDKHLLDKYYAVDGEIHFTNRGLLTFQFKVRRREWRPRLPWRRQKGEFTLEHYSDIDNKTEGERFHLAADIYIFTWSRLQWLELGNPELWGYIIFRISQFKEGILSGAIDSLTQGQNNYHSRANFDCYDPRDFPDNWMIAMEPSQFWVNASMEWRTLF